MGKRDLILTVIPEAGGRAVSVGLPQWIVLGGVVFLLVGLVLLGVFVKKTVERSLNASLTRTRDAENRIVLEKMQEFNAELDMIVEKVESLQTMGDKVRGLSYLEFLEQDLASLSDEFGHPERGGSDDEMAVKLSTLLAETDSLRSSLEALLQFMGDRRATLDRTPSIRPASGWLIASYGYTKSPFTGRTEMHTGVDIAALEGTPIHATAEGVVSFVGRRPGYGLTVVLDHGRGLSTLYGHCSAVKVRVGESVRRGRVIAAIGKTGQAIGPHVQYEVRVNGEPVDPEEFFLDAVAQESSP